LRSTTFDSDAILEGDAANSWSSVSVVFELLTVWQAASVLAAISAATRPKAIQAGSPPAGPAGLKPVLRSSIVIGPVAEGSNRLFTEGLRRTFDDSCGFLQSGPGFPRPRLANRQRLTNRSAPESAAATPAKAAAAKAATAAEAAAAARTAPAGSTAAAGTARSATWGAEHRFGLHRDQSLALGALARELAGAANRLRLFPCFLFRGLFVVAAKLHLAEDALALHFLFQRLESLVDIVVADENLHASFLLMPFQKVGDTDGKEAFRVACLYQIDLEKSISGAAL